MDAGAGDRDQTISRLADHAIAQLVAATDNEPLDRRTVSLLHSVISDSLAMVAEGIAQADLKLVAAAFSEIRDGLSRFQPHAGVRKVTVFGSARTRPDEPEYELAREFGRRIVAAGYMVITGAGPGTMAACQEGAGRDRSFGVNIRLPFEQEANEIIRGDDKLVEFKYFFTRKLFFLKEASALVLFPGGFGTHDEMFEGLTLVQTGKSQMLPVVCLDVARGTFWKTWDRYIRDHLVRKGLIGVDDLALYKVTDSIEEAVNEIVTFYRNYHSARFVRERLVMRIHEPLGNDALSELSEEFADILGGKKIQQRGAMREESDEPHLADKPRLVMHFDKRSYGRLRQLIDRVNRLEAAVKA